MEPSSKRVILVLLVCLVVGVQGIKFWLNVDGAQKIVALNLMEYHSKGREEHDLRLERQLATLPGVSVHEIRVVEDRDEDELRVEVAYSLPLKVLIFSFDTDQVAKARTPILGL